MKIREANIRDKGNPVEYRKNNIRSMVLKKLEDKRFVTF